MSKTADEIVAEIKRRLDAYFKASEERAKLIDKTVFVDKTELTRLRKIEAAAKSFLSEGEHYYHGTGTCPGCKRCNLEQALEGK